MAHFNILPLQNPEFKILAEFKILGFQNHEFKLLTDFKFLASQTKKSRFKGNFSKIPQKVAFAYKTHKHSRANSIIL